MSDDTPDVDELDDDRVVVVDGDVNRVQEYEADDRGRITLGADYSNETVPVAILGPKEEDEDG